MADLLFAASREKSDDGGMRIEARPPEEFLAGRGRLGATNQRVAHVFDRDSSLSIDGFLEIENAKHLVDARLHLFQPAPPPSPDLRTYKIDNSDASLSELLRQAQVEVWEIDEDSEVGSPAVDFVEQ